MAKKVSVDDKNVHHLIHQAYMAGGKFQWVREGLVNALQADAKWVHFGIEESGYRNRGVLRRYIADNGAGMSPDEIDIFLGSFGGGGRAISDHENFGQGFKSSCYEWNPFGIVVISWTRENPDGVLIWIHCKLDSNGNPSWELKDFRVIVSEGGNEQEEVVHKIEPNNQVLNQIGVELDALSFPKIKEAGQGTVFLFLGDSESRDTAGGDFLRQEEEAKRGIVQYINRRFLRLPEDVEVTVENLEAKRKSSNRRDTKDKYLEGANGEIVGVHSRRVKGLESYIPEGSASGEFEIAKGTTVKWYLAPDGEKAVSGSDGPSKSQIVLDYDREAYETRDKIRDFRSFGVMDPIRDRVWLILTPPKYDPHDRSSWGVLPQGSRGSLIAVGGERLPWDEWFDSFFKSFPQELHDATNKASQGVSDEDRNVRRDRLKRVMTRLSTRFRPRAVVQSNSGEVQGVDTGGRTGTSRDLGGVHDKSSVDPKHRKTEKDADSGGDGVIRIIRPEPDGSDAGQEKTRSDGIPAVQWDETFGEGDERFAAARFDEKGRVTNEDNSVTEGVIHLNVNFPLFQTEFRYWVEQYPQAPEGMMQEIVKSVYEDEVVSKVLHAKKMMATPVTKDESGSPVRVSKVEIERWTSPESLTAGLLGLVNVEQRIISLASSNFGGRKALGENVN